MKDALSLLVAIAFTFFFVFISMTFDLVTARDPSRRSDKETETLLNSMSWFIYFFYILSRVASQFCRSAVKYFSSLFQMLSRISWKRKPKNTWSSFRPFHPPKAPECRVSFTKQRNSRRHGALDGGGICKCKSTNSSDHPFPACTFQSLGFPLRFKDDVKHRCHWCFFWLPLKTWGHSYNW